MADNKNSFIAYCDWIHTVSKLPDEKAGLLFKHLLSYVNDQNPITDDLIVEIAFEPIKQSLKRDLKRYEEIKKKRSESGSLGGRPKKQTEAKKANGFSEKQSKAKKADSVSVSVSVSDSDSEKKRKEKDIFNFKNSLLNLNVEEKYIKDWLLVRKKKKATDSETAFNSIVKQIESSKLTPSQCIELCAIKGWVGFNNSWVTEDDLKLVTASDKHENETTFNLKAYGYSLDIKAIDLKTAKDKFGKETGVFNHDDIELIWQR